MGGNVAAHAPQGGFVQFAHDLIHTLMPHEKGAIYAWTIVFCLAAVVFVYWRCRARDAHACLQDKWILTTIVHAAPMPIYILMPFAPLDSDLMAAVAEDQIVIAIAGIYALYVSVGEVLTAANKACLVKAGQTAPATGNTGKKKA